MDAVEKLSSDLSMRRIRSHNGSYLDSRSSIPRIYSSSMSSKIITHTASRAERLQSLITHLPDMVVNRLMDCKKEPPALEKTYGVIVFADVSGFTALTEKFCNDNSNRKKGTDQLTSTLNNYLSRIVQSILDGGGDILKFAGDAILSFWKCSYGAEDSTYMVTSVVEKCLLIQQQHDNYQAGEDINLRMKLAISVGDLFVYHLGNEKCRTFALGGQAVEDANIGQSLAHSGSVVVSPGVWTLCSQDKFFGNRIGKTNFMEVVHADQVLGDGTIASVGQATSRASRRSHASILTTATTQNLAPNGKGASMWKRAYQKVRSNSTLAGLPEARSSCDSLFLQRNLQNRLNMMSTSDEDAVRSYIQPAVLEKIDHGHGLAWLSELRTVSVLFINLVLGIKGDNDKKLALLQSVFNAIDNFLMMYEGSLNKVFMFDKGCTFLCVFGLPQALHELRALRAAREIFHALDVLDIKQHAIGVTTGVAFCGVIGHPQRHEYTVISQKVNMAARLMMEFPNAVTCDEVTKHKSRLPEEDFEVQPPVTLKGIASPGEVYAFSTEKLDRLERYYHHVHLDMDTETLVGRDEEMGVFLTEVEKVKSNIHREHGIIILSAVDGMGKSKLMRAMKAKAAHMGFKIVSGVAGIIEQNTPFFAVKTLITRLLELDTCHNAHEREQLILEHVTDEDARKNLPLINDLLMVKFPQTPATMKMSSEVRNTCQHKLLYSIIHGEALAQPCILGVDDAHWIDHHSWSFLMDLAKESNTIVLLSMMPLAFEGRGKSYPQGLMDLIQLPGSRVLQLKPLKPEKMVELACYLLGVDELPKPVEDIIRERSHGIPLFCEELVESMLEQNVLNFHSVVKSNKVNSRDRKMQWQRKVSCSLNTSISLSSIPIPESINDMILSRVNHLPYTAQVTLKCAAILGNTFTKEMLKGIIPRNTISTFNNSMRLLQVPGIIRCAVAEAYKVAIDDGNEDHFLENKNFYCPCLENLQYYSSGKSLLHVDNALMQEHNLDYCEILQFSHPIFQETMYGLSPEEQCMELHRKAAVFLESQAHKCKSCGGGGFVAGIQNMQNMAKAGDNGRSKKDKLSGNIRAFVGLTSRKARARRRQGGKVAPAIRDGMVNSSTRRHSDDVNSQRSRRRTSSVSVNNWVSNARFSATWRNTKNLSQQNMSGASSTQWDDAFAENIIDVDLQDCHCADILAHVYPQLIIHWKAAGDTEKTVHYLIEAANAAIATSNDMEAIALLDEAKELIVKSPKRMLSEHEMAVFESSYGQALFQSGRVKESIHHFQKALHILGTRMPTSKIGSALNIAYQAVKQYLHIKQPQYFLGRKQNSEHYKKLQDRAHCMAHMTQAFHLQHENMLTLMAALQQLNAAEESGDVHELIEAYAVMIECCQLYNLENLGEFYIYRANYLVSELSFNVDDLVTYAHLLSVSLNFELCHGKICQAGRAGETAVSIATKLHESSLQLSALPQYMWTQLMSLNNQAVKGCLIDLKEVSEEADDLRASALYACCKFDTYLETGLSPSNMHDLLSTAEQCCQEDVYHFDNIERFFLITCLATWHARTGDRSKALNYMKHANSLMPKQFETFLSMKAYARYVECLLVLYSAASKEDKITKRDIKRVLNKFTELVKPYPVFKARAMHLMAYYKIITQKFSQARKLLREAIASSRAMRNDFDAYWAEYNQLCWFTPNDQLLERVLTSKGNFFPLPAIVKPSDSQGNRFNF